MLLNKNIQGIVHNSYAQNLLCFGLGVLVGKSVTTQKPQSLLEQYNLSNVFVDKTALSFSLVITGLILLASSVATVYTLMLPFKLTFVLLQKQK